MEMTLNPKSRHGPTTTVSVSSTHLNNAVVGLSLSLLVSPMSCFDCHCHFAFSKHQHRRKMTRIRPSSVRLTTTTTTTTTTTQWSARIQHCNNLFLLREDKLGETQLVRNEEEDDNNTEDFQSYDSILFDTMMDENSKSDPDDGEDGSVLEQSMHENHVSRQSPSSLATSTLSSSSTDSSGNATKTIDNNILKSNSKREAKYTHTMPKERRPSNRRMQVFAYLSKPVVEVRIIGLVLLSCFLQAITTLDSLPPFLYGAIEHVDTMCVYIFATEFFARWWSAGQLQLRYLARPLVCIDAIVVILPLILNGLLPLWDFGVVTGFFPPVNLPSWLLAASSANSALLNLRLLRILKFQRVLTDETTYMNFEMALGMKKSEVRPYQLQLARVVISIFTLVSVSTGLIYSAEHEVNPQIPDYFTALYFGLTTLTTVGFGDISPITVPGRFVVGASILAGVAIIPAQAANLAEAYLDFMKDRAASSSSSSAVMRGMRSKPKQSSVVTFNSDYSTKGVNGIRKEVNCGACGEKSHRVDARFCWSCGNTVT